MTKLFWLLAAPLAALLALEPHKRSTALAPTYSSPTPAESKFTYNDGDDRDSEEREDEEEEEDSDSDSESESESDSESDSDSDNEGDPKGRPKGNSTNDKYMRWGLTDMSLTPNISTIESTYKNWVGTGHGAGADMACYRETHIASECPFGFEPKLGTCWAECPLDYPIQCGMQCIRQNDDCGLETLAKVSVVLRSALSLATLGVYGAFEKLAKGTQTAISCAKEVANLVRGLSKYVKNVQTTDPQTTTEEILILLYQTDNVIFDVPITIMSCLGIKVSANMKFSDRVTNTVGLFLKEIVMNKDAILSSWESFMNFTKNISLDEAFDDLDDKGITSLQTALESNTTCGHDMKRLTDRVWLSVARLREDDPNISEDDIRAILSKSNLMHHDVPTITNNCMGQLINETDKVTAYNRRDTLRKTFSGIVDDLISSGTSDNGTLLSAKEYAYTAADKALLIAAVWDPTNVFGVYSEYFQSICGPTVLLGEIDDGSAKDALGLNTVGKAFHNSTGSWRKKGSGAVTITFQSKDTKKVTVNIMSGGDEIDDVELEPGEEVKWTSNVTTLGGKTLYLDRWRPGFLGLPGSGGGSLLLWVPRSSHGGELNLTVLLQVS